MIDPRDNPSLEDPLVGTTLAGRYRILRKLASGGMGVVYVAVQEPLGREVALKVVREDAADDPVLRRRFEREAKVVSSLQDPNIVTVHDFGVTESGSLFLAMELVDGLTLRQALQRRGRLAYAEVLPLLMEIARGLAHAHEAGLVHRDLKPENIMIVRPRSSSGDALPIDGVKILDFGLAKPVDTPLLTDALTQGDGFVGTPGYISPEQLEGAEEHPRQDVYALGVIAYEVLTGRHPFAADTPLKQLVRVLREDPPELRGALPSGHDVPDLVGALIDRCLSRDPAVRPKDAQAFLGALGDASGQETPRTLQLMRSLPADAETEHGTDFAMKLKTAFETLPPSTDPTASTPSGSRRMAARSIGLIAILVAAITIGLGVWHGSADGPDPARSTPGNAQPVQEPVDVTSAGKASSDEEPSEPLVTRVTTIIVTGLESFGELKPLRAVAPAGSVVDVVEYKQGRAVLRAFARTSGSLADALSEVSAGSYRVHVVSVEEETIEIHLDR